MARGIGSNIKLLTGKNPGTTTARSKYGIGANINKSVLPALTGQGQTQNAQTGGAFGGLRRLVGQNRDALTTPAEQAPERQRRPMAETDVGKITAELVAGDSPMLEGARLRGTQAAASRGLLSSSIAVQAAEQAAYDAALPLAQTQAQINATKNQNRLDRRFERGQNVQDRQLQVDLKNLDLNAVDRAKVGDLVATAQSNYESALDAIMKNENLSAEQRQAQVAKLKSRYQARVAGIQDLYNVDISFDVPQVRGGGNGGGNGSGGGNRNNNNGGSANGGGGGDGADSGVTLANGWQLPSGATRGQQWTAPNGQVLVWTGSRWATVG